MKQLTKLDKIKPLQWVFMIVGLWLEIMSLPPIYHHIISDISPTFTLRLNLINQLTVYGNEALILYMVFSIVGLFVIIVGIKGNE